MQATYTQKRKGEAWEWYYIDSRAQVPWTLSTQEIEDKDGWAYATNWASDYVGSATGGYSYFTRWRRLVRKQVIAMRSSRSIGQHSTAQRSEGQHSAIHHSKALHSSAQLCIA